MVNGKKNVALFCTSFRFSQIEFNKPPFCLMYYLKKVYGVESEIYFDEVLFPLFYREKGDFTLDSYQGVKLNKINRENDSKKDVEKKYISVVSKNAKNLDLLILFHGNRLGLKLASKYKKLNRNGKVLTVLDYSTTENSEKIPLKTKIKNYLKKILIYKKYAKICDVFTIQTTSELDNIKRHKWNGVDISHKLEMMPFGLDYEKLNLTLDCRNKKKIMTTVGRLGTEEKNTRLILNALNGIDLKDWEFHLVGPIEHGFEKEIEKFYSENEILKNEVRFIGAVEDRDYISRIYAESKVFVLSSSRESFAIVLVESATFGNYILSTDVGCVRDVIKFDNGKIYSDSDELKKYITDVVNGKIDVSKAENCKENIINSFNWNSIVKNSAFLKNWING